MLVTSSFALGAKIVVFVNNDLDNIDKHHLQALLNTEIDKYKRNFNEVVFMSNDNKNKSKSFYLG